MAGELKLKAETAEDLAIIAVFLQDAVVTVGDLAHIPGRRSFAAMFSRYKWEDQVRDHENRRILSGLHFESVLEVHGQNIPQSDGRRPLDLLHIGCEEHGDAAATITLMFANNAAIRLEVECIDAYLRDIGEPWSTPRTPKHHLSGDGV